MKMITKISNLIITLLTLSYGMAFADPMIVDSVKIFNRIPLGSEIVLKVPTQLISVIFSPRKGCVDSIINILSQADKTIDLAIYGFTNESIFTVMLNAKNRGVKIRVIQDYVQSKGATSLYPKLKASGFDIITLRGTGQYGVMHNKFAVVDSVNIITGSYNWTNNAERNNFENLLIIRDRTLSLVYLTDFETMWGKVAH